jgi:hypothetical protein
MEHQYAQLYHTELHEICQSDLNGAELKIEELNWQFHARDTDFKTPLYYLCCNPHITPTSLQIAMHYCDVYRKINKDLCYLHLLFQNHGFVRRYAEFHEILRSANLMCTTFIGKTCLHLLCENPEITLNTLNLLHDRDFNVYDKKYLTPVHYLCLNPHIPFVVRDYILCNGETQNVRHYLIHDDRVYDTQVEISQLEAEIEEYVEEIEEDDYKQYATQYFKSLNDTNASIDSKKIKYGVCPLFMKNYTKSLSVLCGHVADIMKKNILMSFQSDMKYWRNFYYHGEITLNKNNYQYAGEDVRKLIVFLLWIFRGKINTNIVLQIVKIIKLHI